MPTRPSTLTEHAPIVMEQVLASLNHDLNLFQTLVQMVLDQIDADLPAMRADVAAKDSVALAASSHRLKGSLGAISAQPAYLACSELNRLARDRAINWYAPALARTEGEIHRLVTSLRIWLAGNQMNERDPDPNPG